ncbi:MAG: hypothetical protein V4654_02140 [Bdellovibrionota bacterium]
MKNLIFIAALAISTTAFAQTKKQTAPPAAVQPTYNSSQKVFGGNIGMNQSAFNLGITFDSGTETGDLGGSFFLQTEKKENGVTVVSQVMTFGAHVNLNVLDQAGWALDLRPGANLSILQDAGLSGDDKTVFGPSLRWSVTRRTAGGMEIGVERLEIWNWFDSEAPDQDAFTSLVFRTRF